MIDENFLAEALTAVSGEVRSAREKFAPFNSAHEGYAVLLEEVDELWDEVKLKGEARSNLHMRFEAKQVAAMAICFMMECCNDAL